MDDALSKSVMSILKFAPLCLLFNGYWLMDNKQFFENAWAYKDKAHDNMKSQHFIGFRICQSSPMILAAILCTISVVIQTVVPEDQLKKMGFTMS